MKVYWALLWAVAGCVSQEQLNGTVSRSRDEFRGTEIIQAEVVMPTDDQAGRATFVARGERGASTVFLGLEMVGDIRSPMNTCSIEATAQGRVIELPRPRYQTGSAGALTGLNPSLIMERFGIVVPLPIAEQILTGAPRFRLCSRFTFSSNATQAQTFRRFWNEFSATAAATTASPAN